jgi:hypothetical protein
MPNLVTSFGVALILIAYLANTLGKLEQNKLYFILNVVGSGFAGYGAFLVELWPIVLLESIWALISFYKIILLDKK